MREFPGRKRSELRILDVGCGNGSQLAVPLSEAGYQVTAVDPHQPSIERGRRLGPAIDFHHGFVNDLVPSKFDCVIISEVLEHLESPGLFLDLSLPYLAESGILIVTVPNGYGEFELDRRLYRGLHADQMVAWLWSVLKGDGDGDTEIVAGSDDASPHVQRFTVSRLREIFRRSNLVVIEERGTSLASGPFISHVLGRFKAFIRLNVSVADRLPLQLASGWMFCLKFTRQSG
jgi:SAM-dependent methyltransferase